jgi:RHH-type proline utilization regulon transcriptional repressor/proline dehydrogenase/delta 1-pyrroline-5-carboxylate dehydrogenase
MLAPRDAAQQHAAMASGDLPPSGHETPSLAPTSAEEDAADAESAVRLAIELLADARRLDPASARRRAHRLARLLDDDASMAFSLVLTDQVARIADPRRAVRRLQDLVRDHGTPSFLGPIDRLLLRGGVLAGHVAPGVVAAAVQRRLRHESDGVVMRAEEPAFTSYLGHRRDDGMQLNVNVLGEAILGDGEASRRLDQVRTLVARPDVDYVSVKVSSIAAQLSSLAFDASVARIAPNLRALYRAAAEAEPRVFVNLDMEEYRDVDLTIAVFQQLLDEPGLEDLDAGIVLQAYLPDSHDAFDRVATWGRARHARTGGRIKIRLVKGANLAMERVDAELHGWARAPYPTKADVDASYKRLLDRALDPSWGGGVRVGLASHNLFDVAWGLVRATRLGASDRLELEMLEGMALGEAEAVRRRAGSLRLYAPVVRRDEFDAAIAYLVRRLDENTGPENFLRDQFSLTPTSKELGMQRRRFEVAVAARREVATGPRRTQDRAREDRRFDPAAPFANEPDTDWALAANRRWIEEALARGPGRLGSVPPLAGMAEVDAAVVTAREAQQSWGATGVTVRAALLVRVAEVLAVRRGEAIAVMTRDASKTVAEADVEVSEAIDMANYYAEAAGRLDAVDAVHAPLGPVVVTPPWNFPFAIPAGGVLAALAAGNTVILKPAPETVLTAWMLANAIWDGGVPREVVQFLPCPDDEVGRRLVTHPDVAAVILTGAYDTARRFLSWRPDLRLHAETSGKNAMVVTAAADLDLAVKDLVRSAFGHAGQKCSAASLVIVERSVLDGGRFLAKLADATRSLIVGPAGELATDVPPLIRAPDPPLTRALTVLDEGEEWLVPPRRLDDGGLLWSPGIRVGVRPGSFFHLTECFGPVLGVLAAHDLAHAIELQNAPAYGLTGGLQSLDPAEIRHWLAAVEVGNAYVNRSTTGAIVRRQPFGGWKRSSVGPAAKAGGPGYVMSLCRWSDREALAGPQRREMAAERYAEAWRTLSSPQDPSGLAAERNELRHVPLPCVVLRVEPDADPEDAALCATAAQTTGTPIVTSHHEREDLDDLAARLASLEPARLRVLGSVPSRLWTIAADIGVHLEDARPVIAGDVELRRWAREQSVSVTNHRHGNTRVGVAR